MSKTESYFLYRRPDHGKLTIANRDTDTGVIVQSSTIDVSAFAGIDTALRGVSLGGGTLAGGLRCIRKLDASQHRDIRLHARYVIFSESEKKLIEASVMGFNWSKHSAEVGHNLWINWTNFLGGFDPEDPAYTRTWIAYDPLNPPAEYAIWKKEYQAELEAYDAKVAEAEAKAVASATPATPAE